MLRDGTELPTTKFWLGHCQVQGIINKHAGTDGFQYGDIFEVRLPRAADWNARFMFQGGGGTEGSLPEATGSAGTLSPTLARGWAIASQDSGSTDVDSHLPSPNAFYLEQEAVVDHAYRSIDVTTQTAKFLRLEAYYGQKPKHSYFVGCSTGGGRRGCGFCLPEKYLTTTTGISIAGDRVFNQNDVVGEAWSVQRIKTITPPPIQALQNG